MNAVFWWGIGIGALLSFCASVVANLLMGKISSQIEKHSKAFRGRQEIKKEERATLINHLRKNPSYSSIYGVLLLARTVIPLTCAIAFVIMFSTLRILFDIRSGVFLYFSLFMVFAIFTSMYLAYSGFNSLAKLAFDLFHEDSE